MAAVCASSVRRTPAKLLKRVLPRIAQMRCLNLQEYQSKQLMETHGLDTQRFRVVSSALDVPTLTQDLINSTGAKEIVIKAQILAGGRGKGVFDNGFKGGVHLTKNPTDVQKIVASMLGRKLVTKQTVKDGVTVSKVMVAEALDIRRETYLAIVLDRNHGGPVIIGSARGGMDIEELAHQEPDAIHKEPVDIAIGVTDAQADKMATVLGFDGKLHKQAVQQIKRLYELFIKVDASQIEVNPFGETVCNRVVCFDAKINFDDNAEFRQKAIFALDDMAETDPREREAIKSHLNYVAMDGNIGCLVNGAGLAMATMDIVKLHGGEPANFLDVGGAVTGDQVLNAFKLMSSDPQVKAILVNVFGGIVNCTIIADGIVHAFRNLGLKVPLIVRLEGTNADAAKDILRKSGLAIIAADGFEDCARKAVHHAKAQ